MAEEEQPLPQIQPQKKEKKKRERQPKQPQKKQQQQQQEIKADDKEKRKTALSDDDKALFGKLEDKYNFEWKDKKAGAVVTRVGDDIIFIRKIPTGAKGFAKYKSGPYLILKTNAKKFEKFKNNEVEKKEKELAEGMADDDEEKEKDKKEEASAKPSLGSFGDDNICFDYFNFSKDYFNEHEKLFADSLKKKKFLFDNLNGEEKKEVQYFGWNEFKRLGIIPSINDETKYIEKLKNFDVEKIQDNIFVKREAAKKKEKEKDLFGIGDEKPKEEEKEEPLPKEDIEIEDDIYNSDSEGMKDTDDDIEEINVQDLQPEQKQQWKQKRQRKQLIQAQNNQLINAGHTPNGEELRALIKYNNNSDSLLKLIVSLSNDNKGEVDFKEIGEIQDLNGDITELYSDMQDLKSKINSSNNAEEKERLLIKYNKKRLKLEDLIKKYSKEAYRLSTLNKKHKATYSNPNYIKNKLNKLK